MTLLGLAAMSQAIEFPEESGRAVFNQAASPFSPTLAMNQDPLCPMLLTRAREIFATGDSAFGELLRPVGSLADLGFMDFRSLPFETVEFDRAKVQQYTLAIGASNIFIKHHWFPGCGGGCETQHWVLSSDAPGSPTVTTEALSEWNLKSFGTARYAVGSSPESLIVYRLDGPAAPKKACAIELVAPEPRSSKNPDVQAMVPVLEAHTLAIQGVIRGAGNCGSLRSHGRAAGASRAALEIALSRPWILEQRMPVENLRLWSLQGMSEFAAFNALKTQFIVTRDRLAAYYVAQKFALNREDSVDLATRALSGATARAFVFGGNYLTPDTAEDQLRTAILQHRPISEIRSIAFETDEIDSALVTRFEGGRAETRSTDSILAVAINYPEALEYLLQRGVSPNRANAFGKTPLMFAAQYDQLRAVELLLARGANLNASTVQPADDCYYTLDSSNVTALHYAARYAAPALLEKLIAAGAATYFEASGRRDGAFAADWLKSYRKFPEDVTARLERSLAVPDASARAEIANSLVKHAAREYRVKRVDSSYQILRRALRASPYNAEALSDLSLVALRAGHTGESLEASTKLLTVSREPTILANAWFNIGLACEPRQYLFFNGSYYCRQSRIYPYLQSWRTQPSPARERKIVEVLTSWDTRTCVIGAGDTQQQYWFASSDQEPQRPRGSDQRIYVRHALNVTIPPEAVQWERQVFDRQRRISTPQRETSTAFDRYDFSSFAVTVLTAEVYPQGALSIGTHACKLN